MSESHSVSQWIDLLKSRESEAAQKLWERYAAALIHIARQKLGNYPRAAADEEDIAQSVFRSICCGAEAGRLSDVANRDDLWLLLIAVTKQKAVDHIRRETAQKRGSGRVLHEAALAARSPDEAFTLDWLIGEAPTPDFAAMLDEQHSRLLGKLRNDQLRSVAISRIGGYTVQEIADDLAMSTRSVERKLRLIRAAWAKDLYDAG